MTGPWLDDHKWPTQPTRHLWGRWWVEKGPPKASQYRVCAHPDCKAIEHREAPCG
jgi:hypothetical protein